MSREYFVQMKINVVMRATDNTEADRIIKANIERLDPAWRKCADWIVLSINSPPPETGAIEED